MSFCYKYINGVDKYSLFHMKLPCTESHQWSIKVNIRPKIKRKYSLLYQANPKGGNGKGAD